MADKYFWADAIAEKIIKEKGKREEYVCASGITPSGFIHIGNFREVITTELVKRALENKGKKVRFIYSWDDYDRFRKVPSNVPESYKKYIGLPVSEFPSPFDKKKSYAKYFEDVFEKSLEKVGVDAEFIRQNEMNKKCKYAPLIKTAIDNIEKIKTILNKYRKEPLSKNWYPLNVYCEKCGKDFTKILNAKGYEIEYECECGFRDKFDCRKKGIVKLSWRVDWPARWKYEKVDFEPGGIDHSADGGSYTTAKDIVKLYDYTAPIYTFYEWVKIKGGGAFHSSSGNALTLDDVEEIYEPEVLRYLFVGTRPNKSFQISFDADVIKTYDEYDKLESKYFEKLANPQENRIYELSQVKNVPKKQPEKLSFRHLITLVQVGKTNDLDSVSKKRAEKVKNWIEKYAPEEFKFEIQKDVKINLTKKQKQAMMALKESLALKKFNEDELLNEFYNIFNAVEIDAKEFFKTAYNLLINKNKGPRLASLILDAGQDKIVKLLDKIK